MFPKIVHQDLWSPLLYIKDNTPAVAGLPSLFDESKSPEIPLPKLFTVEWTEPASTGNGPTLFPPTYPELISVPDPQEKPALYKAAVDAIRVANDYFVKSGCGSGLQGPNSYPTKEWLCQLADSFSARYESEDHDFMEPPDLRILWVTDKHYHPCDKKIPWKNRLWVVACKQYYKLDEEEKINLLLRTHPEQQKDYERSFSDVNIYNKFLVGIFMKYIAHVEQDAIIRESQIDVQPTDAALDAFFAAPENADGVTLYDLHRTFFRVKDIKEFVKRVEVFAKYVPHPPRVPGLDEVPEGVYIRKNIPSISQLESVMQKPTTFPEIFQNLGVRYKEYANGVGSQVEVYRRVLKTAAPDITTGRLIMKKINGKINCPSEKDIRIAVRDSKHFDLESLAGCFPDAIASRSCFEERVLSVAAPDAVTGHYIRKDTQPTAQEIHRVLTKHVCHQHEDSVASVMKLFPDRVWNRVAFAEDFAKVAFWKGYEEGKNSPWGWLPLKSSGAGSDELLDWYESQRIYALEHLLRTNPMQVLDWVNNAAVWDGSNFNERLPVLEDTVEPESEEEWQYDAFPQVIDLTSPASSPAPSPPSSNKRKRDVEKTEDENENEDEFVAGSPRPIKKLRA